MNDTMLDTTGPLRLENENLKRELEKYQRWVASLGQENAAIKAGIDSRLNGRDCPENTWAHCCEYAAKLECLNP